MNLKQHSFVTEYLRFGDVQIAYRNAYKCYSSSSRTIESAGNRLLKNPEIAQAIKNAQERIRYEVEEELKQEQRRQLLSVQRKREILAMIAEGEVYIEHNYKGRDCRNCKQLIKPSFGQMLKAIDLDSKLAGHYGAKKPLSATMVPEEKPTAEPPKQEAEVPVQVEKTEVKHTNSQQFATNTTPQPCDCDTILPADELKQLFVTPHNSLKVELVE